MQILLLFIQICLILSKSENFAEERSDESKEIMLPDPFNSLFVSYHQAN
jgi:hypothetical protein